MIPEKSDKKNTVPPYTVVALCLINLLLFTFGGLSEWFAFSPRVVLTEPWRLLTALFLHPSVTNLIVSLSVLAVFGKDLEERLKGGWLLTAYFGGGVAGMLFYGIASLFGEPAAPYTGASAAVLGVVGTYMYQRPHSAVTVVALSRPQPVLRRVNAVGLTLVYLVADLWAGSASGQGGLAFVAHLCGYVCGWLLARFRHLPYQTAEQTKTREVIEAAEGHLGALPLADLARAYDMCPENPQVSVAYCLHSARSGARRKAVEVMHTREQHFTQCPADELAYVILELTQYDGNPPGWLILRTALRLIDTDPGLAEALLWRLLRNRPRPTGELLEKGLARLAGLLDAKETQTAEAAALYVVVCEEFPMSDSAVLARLRLKEIGVPEDLVFLPEEGKVVKLDACTPAAPPALRPMPEPSPYLPPVFQSSIAPSSVSVGANA
ncbi:MAG: rhomboid family intramembrane serine protease [Capsulimonadales bacterium]|nr:rhomboid family intramembrane serine protease [Capsulimonadales bacterium]